MAQKQKTPGAPTEDTKTDGPVGLKRAAPESSGLLKQIDTKLKTKEAETQEQKVRRILKSCGCL